MARGRGREVNEAPLRVEREGGVTRLFLACPEKLNAFSAALVDALLGAVRESSTDGTRLLVLSAEGKGFSGGFDFTGIETQSSGDLLLRFVRVELLLQAVHHAPHATPALVHGACYGPPADLALACTHRVAAPDARLRMPGLQFGVVLGTRRLVNAIGPDAARSVLETTRVVAAEEALSLGLVHAVRPRSEWEAVEAECASRARTLEPHAQTAFLERTREDTRDADLAALVRSVADADVKARIEAFLARNRKG